jgi:hypothetical protein
MIGIQNNRYPAREVRERRYALPASTISSKSESFLNIPADCFHHGTWDAFRSAFNSDLICAALVPAWLREKNTLNAELKKVFMARYRQAGRNTEWRAFR